MYVATLVVGDTLCRIDTEEGKGLMGSGTYSLMLTLTSRTGEVSSDVYSSRTPDGSMHPAVMALIDALQILRFHGMLGGLRVAQLGSYIGEKTLDDCLESAYLTERITGVVCMPNVH